MKKLLALALALMMILGIFAGCSNKTNDTPGNTNVSDSSNDQTTAPTTDEETPDDSATTDVYQMEGSVTIAYPEAEVAEIQPVLEAFRAQYPNIEVVEEPFPGSTGGAFNEYLTQKAAANDMPDLMWLDWNDFAPQVASGFVYDISEMFYTDPESEWVSSGMTDA